VIKEESCALNLAERLHPLLLAEHAQHLTECLERIAFNSGTGRSVADKREGAFDHCCDGG
jgi:hypothetical protein